MQKRSYPSHKSLFCSGFSSERSTDIGSVLTFKGFFEPDNVVLLCSFANGTLVLFSCILRVASTCDVVL